MMLQKTEIIALANQKGGCGKTTTAVNLAAGFAQEGYRACLVDADAQCNATKTFGEKLPDEIQRAGKFTLVDAYLAKRPAREISHDFGDRFKGRLGLVPGNSGLRSVSHRLEAQLRATIASDDYSDLDADDIKNEHRQRLKNSLRSLQGEYDVVIIDTPPELDFIMTSSLIAADWYIIPVFPSGYDLHGLETLTRTIEKVQKRYNPKLRLLGVLVGDFDARTKLDKDVHNMLTKKFGGNYVFPETINSSVKLRETTVYCETIYEHSPGEQPAEQFKTLTREVITRLEATQGVQARAQVELLEGSRG